MPVHVSLTYQGDLQCVASHGPSGQTLETDAPVDNGGKGATFSPTDLVATATGACMLTLCGLTASRLGLELPGASAQVVKYMTESGPRRISRLEVVLSLPESLSQDDRRRLEAAARTCPVARSLHPDIEVALTFRYP